MISINSLLSEFCWHPSPLLLCWELCFLTFQKLSIFAFLKMLHFILIIFIKMAYLIFRMTFIGPWSESTWVPYIVMATGNLISRQTPTSHLCTELKTKQNKPQKKNPNPSYLKDGTLPEAQKSCTSLSVLVLRWMCLNWGQCTEYWVAITSHKVSVLFLSEERVKSSEQWP